MLIVTLLSKNAIRPMCKEESVYTVQRKSGRLLLKICENILEENSPSLFPHKSTVQPRAALQSRLGLRRSNISQCNHVQWLLGTLSQLRAFRALF